MQMLELINVNKAYAEGRKVLAHLTYTLKAEIENGAEFGQLAQQHSLCPSGKQGGDLGEFGRGQMVKEFDTVVFSAPVGEVQGPVKTQFGYHLLEVTKRSD